MHSWEIHISTLDGVEDEKRMERKWKKKSSRNSLKSDDEAFQQKIYAKHKHLLNTSVIIPSYLYARQKLQTSCKHLKASKLFAALVVK